MVSYSDVNQLVSDAGRLASYHSNMVFLAKKPRTTRYSYFNKRFVDAYRVWENQRQLVQYELDELFGGEKNTIIIINDLFVAPDNDGSGFLCHSRQWGTTEISDKIIQRKKFKKGAIWIKRHRYSFG